MDRTSISSANSATKVALQNPSQYANGTPDSWRQEQSAQSPSGLLVSPTFLEKQHKEIKEILLVIIMLALAQARPVKPEIRLQQAVRNFEKCLTSQQHQFPNAYAQYGAPTATDIIRLTA
jgi:hypothetical protein